ncbi:MAG: hypothetical protein ISS72_09860 [Candidatus Brocadiae bacterium]|nr:hypothetical protein [Candidatus Brocadiia bacterium]
MVRNTKQADETLMARVRAVYGAEFPNALVDVSPGYADHIHVILVSREFDDMPEAEKQSVLWRIAEQELGDDRQLISLMLAYSPDELK